MNGKQAKRLRRAALGLAATIEQSGHKVEKEGYRFEDHKVPNPDRASVRSDIPPSKSPIMYYDRDVVVARTLHVDERSVKGIYKQFKKGK